MDLNVAYGIVNGNARFEDFVNITDEEALQLIMGACLTDEGDIVCLKCGYLNECCSCP
jgi:MoaA/NifB/PqqE/SkfB family radical SAM enzyme